MYGLRMWEKSISERQSESEDRTNCQSRDAPRCCRPVANPLVLKARERRYDAPRMRPDFSEIATRPIPASCADQVSMANPAVSSRAVGFDPELGSTASPPVKRGNSRDGRHHSQQQCRVQLLAGQLRHHHQWHPDQVRVSWLVTWRRSRSPRMRGARLSSATSPPSRLPSRRATHSTMSPSGSKTRKPP